MLTLCCRWPQCALSINTFSPRKCIWMSNKPLLSFQVQYFWWVKFHESTYISQLTRIHVENGNLFHVSPKTNNIPKFKSFWNCKCFAMWFSKVLNYVHWHEVCRVISEKRLIYILCYFKRLNQSTWRGQGRVRTTSIDYGHYKLDDDTL